MGRSWCPTRAPGPPRPRSAEEQRCSDPPAATWAEPRPEVAAWSRASASSGPERRRRTVPERPRTAWASVFGGWKACKNVNGKESGVNTSVALHDLFEREPSIHNQGLAGYVTGRFRTEKGDDVGDVVRLRHST